MYFVSSGVKGLRNKKKGGEWEGLLIATKPYRLSWCARKTSRAFVTTLTLQYKEIHISVQVSAYTQYHLGNNPQLGNRALLLWKSRHLVALVRSRGIG